MIAILHNIRSLHNVGSIFRTADGAGVEKLYLCGITPAPVDCFNKPRPQLVKVSLGAEKNMTWEKVAQTGRLIDKLKKEGYLVLGVEQDKRSVPYYKVNEILRKASADAKASKESNIQKVVYLGDWFERKDNLP
ncbi:MAG: TrmH family RNA methyltransferase, partial [Patescibacteria group bacterium]